MKGFPFLAFDLGAESGRAVLGVLDGGNLAVREIHRFPNIPLSRQGQIHWNVDALFNEMTQALSISKRETAQKLESISVDTWGVDFGLLDGEGNLIGLPFCYRDSRTEGAMEEFFTLLSRRELYEATGIQFMPFNTLFQIYSMVRDRSPLLEQAADLLFMPDVFNYLLTGIKATEFTIATTSQIYNPRNRDWEWKLFQVMGLPIELLQTVLEPGTVLGPLRQDVAREAHLTNTPVVATASHDTGAAVAAVPAEGENWAYISSGTWSLVGIEVKRPIITQEALEGNFTNEGGVGSTIRFLKNITGLWLVQQCRKAWSDEEDLSYDDLTRMASEAEPYAALIDPDSPEFLNPVDMPEAIRTYCRKTGQTPPELKSSFVRSVLESLALKYRYVIEQIERITGRPIDNIHVIGGGAKNHLLCQFTADATGRLVVAGPVEATAVGNILVQAIALGRVGSHSEMRQIIRNSFKLLPFEPQQTFHWDEAYERFRLLLET